jgi:hypothetical protein
MLFVFRKELFSFRMKEPFFAFLCARFVDKDRPSPLSASIGVSSNATEVLTFMLDCDLLFRRPIRFHNDDRGVAISLGLLGGASVFVMLTDTRL